MVDLWGTIILAYYFTSFSQWGRFNTVISVIFHTRKLIPKRLNNLFKVTVMTRNPRSNLGNLTQRSSQCTCVCACMCAEARGGQLSFFIFFLLNGLFEPRACHFSFRLSVQVQTILLPLSYPRTGILRWYSHAWLELPAVVSCPVPGNQILVLYESSTHPRPPIDWVLTFITLKSSIFISLSDSLLVPSTLSQHFSAPQ